MMQAGLQTAAQVVAPGRVALVPTPMHVSLAVVEQRVHVWLRFGRPLRVSVVNPWRRVAVFAPGAICCRVKWLANDYGLAIWELMVMRAPTASDDAQRIAGVVPGAHILVRAVGESQVNSVLTVIDNIEALGIDPCAVAMTYWCAVGRQLAAGQSLPTYEVRRHGITVGRGALQ